MQTFFPPAFDPVVDRSDAIFEPLRAGTAVPLSRLRGPEGAAPPLSSLHVAATCHDIEGVLFHLHPARNTDVNEYGDGAPSPWRALALSAGPAERVPRRVATDRATRLTAAGPMTPLMIACLAAAGPMTPLMLACISDVGEEADKCAVVNALLKALARRGSHGPPTALRIAA